MTLQPTHPAPGLSSALCPRESGYTSHPLFPVSIDFPRLRAELSEEQAHLGSAGGTWGCASPVPGCRAPAPPKPLPGAPGQGLSGPLPAPAAVWLPPGRLATSARGRPGSPHHPCPPPSLPGWGSAGGGPLGLRQSPSCACARVTPGPEGSLYRDALPAGLCTYCKKQLFESCCFWVLFSFPCPVPSSRPFPLTHFTWLERRSLAPVLTMAAWWPQPALLDAS